jgi:uncharacterized protein (TIGR02118 family)
MLKFMVLFQKPSNPVAMGRFETAYNDFLALVERMPDIQRRQVVNVVGSPKGVSPYYRILEVYFADKATLEASLRSPAGQEAGNELVRRFIAGTYETLFAEIYEEAGGSTPTNLPPDTKDEN